MSEPKAVYRMRSMSGKKKVYVLSAGKQYPVEFTTDDYVFLPSTVLSFDEIKQIYKQVKRIKNTKGSAEGHTMSVTITQAAKVPGLMAGSNSEETRADVVAIVKELEAENEMLKKSIVLVSLEARAEVKRLKKRPPLIGPV